MHKIVFTEEMIQYLIQIAEGHYDQEITDLMNERFNADFTKQQIKNLKARYKIKSNLAVKVPTQVRKAQRIYSDEFIDYLKKIAPGKGNAELAEILNNKFSMKLDCKKVKQIKANYRISSGLTGYFEKGHIPVSKGKKMSAEQYELCKATMFKKGNRPHNTRPVGSERITKDGYVEVKIAEPNKWQLKHRLVWEQAYGKIDDKNIIIFLDGNPQNLDLDNLACIDRNDHRTMNKFHLRTTDKDLTQANLNITKLKRILNNKKKNDKN